LLLFAVAGTVWGVVAYIGLVRLQVEVADACSRVEADSRSRAELVANMIHGSSALGLAPDRLARLSGAMLRADVPLPSVHVLQEPERYRDFLSGQKGLSQELADLWPALSGDAGPGSRVLVEDFADDLERASALLANELQRLDRSIAAYHSAVGTFPRSLVAAIANVERPSGVRSLLSNSQSARTASGPPG
jgi:hypothetical protein